MPAITDRLRPLLDRQAGPRRPTGRPRKARRRARAHLHRPWAHRHEPGPAGLDQALAAVRAGDTLVVPKLDRLARSVPDARTIADALVARGVKLALGSSVYDPADPMGKMFFNILATFAEFEADLIRLRTREGMAIARAGASCGASSPSCPTSSRASCAACTTPATTRSATWPSCSRSPEQPS